jgi:uncharacterized membrane protein YsdA (DUF1294 family)/cold shock CspA family protein
MREQGRVVEWNDERGFGFVVPLGGDTRHFAHIREFPRGQRRPVATDLVTYVAARDEHNRPQARQIAFVAPAQGREEAARPLGYAELAVPVVFVVAVLLLAVCQRVPWIVPGAYALMSLAAFVAYWRDKAAAARGGWRTSEATLLGFALFGGWPGAYLARHLFRHKTRKQPFRLLFWLAVAVNCAALVYLVSLLARHPG